MHEVDIRQLRKDASRLETVARHLRSRAKLLAAEDKMEKNAKRASKAFFSKQANLSTCSVDMEPIFTSDKVIG